MDISKIISRTALLQEHIDRLPGVLKKDTRSSMTLNTFDIIITNSNLRKITKKLFDDGHHARAVEEAFKYVNNCVKDKANSPNLDGAKLMKDVFSANSPKLKLNSGHTDSEKNEQLGYMEIFAGCMTGIRNPRAHEHDWEDTEERALQLLSLANHLLDKIKNC